MFLPICMHTYDYDLLQYERANHSALAMYDISKLNMFFSKNA